MEKTLKRYQLCILFTLGVIICLFVITQKLKNEIIQYEVQNTQLNEQIESQKETIEKLNAVVEDLSETIIQQDTQLKDVSSINKSYVDELTELRLRSELYDKYSYAIINESKERTNLTYEEIKYGEELMKEKGYDPNLMFGTIMVESGGDPSAVNSQSGATGYGQFLDSTAKFVWKNLLHNDSYSSEIRKDGKSNIKMMAEYYDYLYNTKDSTFEVIKQYSGNSTDEGARKYLARINNYTKKVGVIIQ